MHSLQNHEDLSELSWHKFEPKNAAKKNSFMVTNNFFNVMSTGDTEYLGVCG